MKTSTGGEALVLRRMELVDISQAVAIERDSDLAAIWDHDDFRRLVHSKDYHPVVLATNSGTLLGYLVFQHANEGVPMEYCQLTCLVTARAYRRQGVARTLLIWLQTCDEEGIQRGALGTCVRESDLPVQQLLKACRFFCDGISSDAYDCPPEPGYIFWWRRSEDPLFTGGSTPSTASATIHPSGPTPA